MSSQPFLTATTRAQSLSSESLVTLPNASPAKTHPLQLLCPCCNACINLQIVKTEPSSAAKCASSASKTSKQGAPDEQTKAKTAIVKRKPPRVCDGSAGVPLVTPKPTTVPKAMLLRTAKRAQERANVKNVKKSLQFDDD